MRQLFLRLRTCEAGAALLEYGLLIAVLALALLGVLTGFRNSVGGLANRTAGKVSTAGGYRYGGGAPIGSPVGQSPASPDPDSSSAEPESPPGEGGSPAAAHLTIP